MIQLKHCQKMYEVIQLCSRNPFESFDGVQYCTGAIENSKYKPLIHNGWQVGVFSTQACVRSYSIWVGGRDIEFCSGVTSADGRYVGYDEMILTDSDEKFDKILIDDNTFDEQYFQYSTNTVLDEFLVDMLFLGSYITAKDMNPCIMNMNWLRSDDGGVNLNRIDELHKEFCKC